MQSGIQAGQSGPTEPSMEEEWTDKAVHLTDDNVSELPYWTFIALYLQGNFELTLIPPMFFHRMALLQVLDLSHTSIKSLPKSLPKLVALKKLLLRGCQLFMVLPSLVGKLENLEELDLDETQIMDLPKDIGKLIKLSHLRVSFYHICGKKKSKSNILIYPETISILSKLTELSIDVNPEDKRWDDSVEAVVKEVCKSETLRTLSLYLPKFQLLDHISLMYPLLSRFSFTVGSHKRRIISRVPYEVEAEIRKWDKCLKFVNGESIPIEIRRVLKYCSSFFLDKHATAMSLSEFGIENVKRLKFCLLAECNKMETIIDGDDQSESGSVEHLLESLEYLSIYYMENLWSIWGGPNRYDCMSTLKFLALHTCPQLSNIFSRTLLENFVNLEEIILEDCPRVTSLVSHGSEKPMNAGKMFLPRLKRLLLLYLPELVSISNGILIAPELESIGFYNCPKLKRVSKMELSSKNLKIIKGECQWWKDVNWNETEWRNRPDYLMRIFSPISNDKDVMTQLLAEVTDWFEATIKIEEQQLDDEMLLEVSTQDKKGETDQWLDYTEETKSGTDMSHATESKRSVSILPSNALLSTSEKTREWEQRNLISELRQGRKLVRQLLLHLNLDSSVEILAHRIEISYEKALSMLRSNTSLALEEKPSELAAKVSESPPPPVGSTPWSEDYDCNLRERMPKKRKTLPSWTERVQVTSDTALEGPLDGCYSWRKYGQKDILGSKYPSTEGILERFERYSYAERQLSANETEQNGGWTLEHARLKARMEVLQRNQRHYMGQDTENLSLRELQNLEQQLESALKHTRSRKNQLLSESISELQKKEKALQEQNNMLPKKVKEKEKAVVQQTQWEQQNNCQDSSSMLLPQRVQTFNIGGTYEARSSGRDEESNPAQDRMAKALLPALMVRHLE